LHLKDAVSRNLGHNKSLIFIVISKQTARFCTKRTITPTRKSNRLTWVRQRFPFRDRRDALLAIGERLEHAMCIRARRQPEMIFERLACDYTCGTMHPAG
jgi:hypothetical protein